MTQFFSFLRWQDILDIVIVAFVIYKVFGLIKGTRARQLLVGLVIIFFTFYTAKALELFTLSWILDSFVASIVLVIMVIFQDDIRRLLMSIGRNPLFRGISYVKQTFFYDELVNACMALSARQTGGLIVIERQVGLEEFMEIGVGFDAEVKSELLISIFLTPSPLHDGAVIIREGRIRAAGCILPLAMKQGIGKDFGTRHRAAIGITEVTDAVAVVVSEERGTVSYAYRGSIFSGVTDEILRAALKEVLK